MHIHLVVILEVSNECRDVAHDRAFRPSIRAVVWAEPTFLFMIELTGIWKHIIAAQALIFAMEFQRFSHPL